MFATIFRGDCLNAICSHLNRERVLPVGYYALAEQATRTMGPDVLTLRAPVPRSVTRQMARFQAIGQFTKLSG